MNFVSLLVCFGCSLKRRRSKKKKYAWRLRGDVVTLLPDKLWRNELSKWLSDFGELISWSRRIECEEWPCMLKPIEINVYVCLSLKWVDIEIMTTKILIFYNIDSLNQAILIILLWFNVIDLMRGGLFVFVASLMRRILRLLFSHIQ